VTILPDGPLCSCGQYGHLEAISSGTAISQYVVEELQKGTSSMLHIDPHPSSKDVAKAALAGDSLAKKAYQRAGFYLGMAMANYLHIFNPTIIICGGGVSRSGDLLFEPVRESLNKHVMDPVYMQNLTLTTAGLGDDAGIMGALAMARSL
jgi:glucokinase